MSCSRMCGSKFVDEIKSSTFVWPNVTKVSQCQVKQCNRPRITGLFHYCSIIKTRRREFGLDEVDLGAHSPDFNFMDKTLRKIVFLKHQCYLGNAPLEECKIPMNIFLSVVGRLRKTIRAFMAEKGGPKSC